MKIMLSKIFNSNNYALQLEIINWIFQTGKNYEISYGWDKDGIDKAFFGYSANNSNSYSDIGRYLKNTIKVGFYNLFLKTDNLSVENWKKDFIKNGIVELKFRRYKNQYIEDTIKKIYKFEGRLLNEKYIQPEYLDRIKPYIHNIKLCTAGYGYEIRLEYSFENTKNSYWTLAYIQQNESIDCFLERTLFQINVLIKKQGEANDIK